LSHLVDTNVLSELRRRAPNERVVAWMEARPRQTLYLSVLTLGEIRRGIERLDDGARRQKPLDWLEVELPTYFLGRLLVVVWSRSSNFATPAWKLCFPRFARPLQTPPTNPGAGPSSAMLSPTQDPADAPRISRSRIFRLLAAAPSARLPAVQDAIDPKIDSVLG